MPNYRDVVVSLSLSVLLVGIAACGSDSEPEPDASLDLPVGAKATPDASRVDANVEFPDALSGLSGSPTHLAVDPATGDLWFVLFSYGTTSSGDNALYRYSRSDGTVEARSIPASFGSELYSAIAVDSRGHVISAEGNVVLDVDPAGGYVQHPLSAEPLNYIAQPGRLGAYVTDMAISADGKAYITRRYVAAVTELDLRTGSVREIPIPASMFLVRHIDLAGDMLWMTTRYSTEATPSVTAVLDLTNNSIETTSMKTSALVADGKGRVYFSTQTDPGVVAADATDASIVAGPWTFTREHDGLIWNPTLLAADEVHGRIWMAGGGSGIVSVDSSAGGVEYYPLPSWAETQPFSVPIHCAERNDCPPPRPAFTHVGGIAVAPNGDVFFSDQSYNRIGIVHPR